VGSGGIMETSHHESKAKRRRREKQERKDIHNAPDQVAYSKIPQDFIESTRWSMSAQMLFASADLAQTLNRLDGELCAAAMDVIGYAFAPPRIGEDESRLVSSLLKISTGPDADEALYSWGHALDPATQWQTTPPLRQVYSLLQTITDNPHPQFVAAIMRGTKETEMIAPCWVMCIGDHLKALASIKNGGLLHQAGSLLLIDSAHGRYSTSDDDLVILRKRRDGLLVTTPPLVTEPITTGEIRSARAFVESYQGHELRGKFLPFPQCEKLGRAIGLCIDNGYGVLAPGNLPHGFQAGGTVCGSLATALPAPALHH
jgi:hypothetical protein